MTEKLPRNYEELIGAHLARIRTDRGLSQRQLAEQMHTFGEPYAKWLQTTINKIEHGDRPLRVNELFDLAKALGVPADFLLDPLPAEPGIRDRLIAGELSTLQAPLAEARAELDVATKTLDDVTGNQVRAERARARAARKVAEIEARIDFLRTASGGRNAPREPEAGG